ncbi:MAG: recombination protein RecR [Spirochaetes bacterium]|nr:recombination protein RecR [Spirochaetota bacterium]
MNYPDSIQQLINLLSKLPGIGKKSAERLGFYILSAPDEFALSLASTLKQIKSQIKNCRICGNYTEDDICAICSSTKRDRSRICVVEDPRDVFIIESLKLFDGLYHILFGIISPLDGISSEDLNIEPLIERIKKDSIKEIIFALSPTAEGETTIMYISKLLAPYPAKITKLAYGLPVGSNIRYADLVTLAKSFLRREDLKGDGP